MSILEIRNLHKSFGALEVINDIDLNIRRGERHAIIGPNGSGKTTLFNLITGWIKPTRGQIVIDGSEQTAFSPQEVTRKGFARSFQRNMLLEGLTVLENLRLAVQAGDICRRNFLRSRDAFPEVKEKARRAAGLVRLDGVLDRIVRELSYGEKRQLEVAIALCSSPKILLLDEPAAGTSPAERSRLVEIIRELPTEVTLLLVEHDMDVVFGVAEAITVLAQGRVIASGTPAQIRSSAKVKEAYLGRRGRA